MALCRTARSAYASLFRPAMTAVQTRGFAFSDVGITSGAPMETFDRKVAAYPNAAARASSIPFHSFSRSFRTTPYAEAKAKTDIGILTEAPGEIYERKVTIFSPARMATTQGLANLDQWRIQLDNQAKWENPLMGWTSTADVMENVLSNDGLRFDTREEAAAFCEKHGWKYEILERNEMVTGRLPKAYSDNFSHKWKGIPAEPKMYATGQPMPYRPADRHFKNNK